MASFWICLSTVTLIWWFVYLACENHTLQLVTLISQDRKVTQEPTGAPEAWGPWARAHQAQWIRQPWTKYIEISAKHDQ